tara:strand:- start:514 stop:648 length:135 start_codon:yes stop_codon:yes gene_type:complete
MLFILLAFDLIGENFTALSIDNKATKKVILVLVPVPFVLMDVHS